MHSYGFMHTADRVWGLTETFVVIPGPWVAAVSAGACTWLTVMVGFQGAGPVTANLIVAGGRWWLWTGPDVVGGFTGSTTGYWTDHCHRFIAYCDPI